MKPRPYLYPIYGLLLAVLIVLIYQAHYLADAVDAHSTASREELLYCVHADELSALTGTPIPTKCLGSFP